MATASSSTTGTHNLEALTMGRNLRLDDLVERGSLQEVIRSFTTLFGISVRVFSAEGQLLADSVEQQAICQKLNALPDGRTACANTVNTIKRIDPPGEQHIVHTCFTGANYNVSSIFYDGRVVGRIIIGPYLPATLREVPGSLMAAAKGLDPVKAADLLPRMPRGRPEAIVQVSEHLGRVLDLILFSGHKALLTSEMHLASVRESYRELQEKNAKLQDAIDRLKELDRLKSNFIATVSHELRTPLTSIIGYSEMLAEGIAGEVTPEQREFIQTIHEKGEQLLSLILSLLDLSKLESGTMSLHRADLDIGNLLRDVVSSLLPTARKKNVNIYAQIGSGIPSFRADLNRLRQVFLNLAENAVKFTNPQGDVVLSACLVESAQDDADDVGFALLSPSRGELEIRVSDTGIGIPEEEREKIFDPFYQVDSSSTREYGGAGLGLAIVRRLVEAHGGTIRIEGNQPQGTSFVVRLPIQPPSL